MAYGGGITLYKSADLVMGGTGTLVVRGDIAAAIGAGCATTSLPDPAIYPCTTPGKAVAGNITISDVTLDVFAYAHEDGAGIGGGSAFYNNTDASAGNITLNNVNLTAKAPEAAAIGGGTKNISAQMTMHRWET